MDLDWQKKVLDLSKLVGASPLMKEKVSWIISEYQRRNQVNRTQLELLLNLRVENHDQFVVLHNNGLGCSLESLMYAVQEDLISSVQAILRQNVHLKNALDAQGNSPIHYALKLGREDIAEVLLEQPADLEQTDSEGNTLLHLAAQSKLDKIFENLNLRYEENKIFAKNTYNDNCIHVALRGGCNTIVKYIFNQLQNIDYGILGFNGNTYLHFAAIGNCDEDILKVLISKTPNINCTNLFRHTPLHEALLHGSKRAARILSVNGSDVTLVGIYNENCYHFAAQGNCYQMIEHLNTTISQNINEKSHLGMTPLHVALAEATVTTIEKFIYHGANLDSVDVKGNSIFHYLAKRNLSELKTYLDDNSPLFHQQNISGYTPLHLSVKHNSYSLFKFLIRIPGNINTYCWKTKNTLLHTAAIVGNWCYVYGLLTNGADPDATNEDGNTPIQLALQHNHLDCVEILLLYADNIHNHFCKRGNGVMHYATNCSLKIITKIIESNGHCCLTTVNNITNDTLYHSAIEYKNLEVIEFLVSQNVPQKANIDEVMPLHLAGKCGDIKIFKALSDQLDSHDIKLKDKKGKSVLDYILSSGNKEIYDHLKERLQTPLDLSQLKDQKNALHYAVKRGRLDILHTLLSNENLVRVIDNLDDDGFAPLHYAVKYGNLKAVECLISFGSNKDVVTRLEFKTPLHVAVINNRIEIAKYLVQIGVNINAQDSRGYAAIHFAVVYGYEDILIFLIQSHASTKLKTNDKKHSPLLLATVLNRVNMMEHLIQCDKNIHTVMDYIKTVLPSVALSVGSLDALHFINNYEGPNYDVIKLLSKGVDEIL